MIDPSMVVAVVAGLGAAASGWITLRQDKKEAGQSLTVQQTSNAVQAIQALNAALQSGLDDCQGQCAELKTENHELKLRLEALERKLNGR